MQCAMLCLPSSMQGAASLTSFDSRIHSTSKRVNEPIVSGQLVKRYTAGSVNYDRPIVKPVSGTVSFSGGGTLDYETGIISGGAGGTWSGEFEIQARFTGDRYTERNYFVDWHEVQLEIVETFDYDIPGAAGASLASLITYNFPLPLEVGRKRYQDWSTYVVQGGGYSEDRFQQYGVGAVGFEGNVLCKNRTDLETLISTFLCVHGRRTGFQYDPFNVRFDRDALVLSYTGNESFQCPLGLVGVRVSLCLETYQQHWHTYAQGGTSLCELIAITPTVGSSAGFYQSHGKSNRGRGAAFSPTWNARE